MRLNNLLVLGTLILLSFFVLSYKLSVVPTGIYSDEAVTGINALSILKTGRDEYGKSFPAAFRFFGSYSPPLYTYLTVLPVFLFGLNEFSVRIVSVFAASLMVIILYWFLTKSSLINKK